MKNTPAPARLRAPRSLFLAASLVLLPAAMQAAVALTFTGGSDNNTIGNYTFGWAFTLSTPRAITDLGIYDAGANGLGEAHSVSIWTSAGALQVSATVPAGTAGALLNSFRYVPLVAPIVLPIGSYTIGAYYFTGSDALRLQVASIATFPGITYTGSRYAGGGNFFPSLNDPSLPNSNFGPNFLVPEPSRALLLLSGAGTLLMRRRRR